MRQTLEEALIAQCAPTLAGVKPASLFRHTGPCLGVLRRNVAAWDEALKPLGLRIRILKECPVSNACMLYLYRGRWMEDILSQPDHRAFLEAAGYRPGGVEAVLAQLAGRFSSGQDYPHEIGLFLGYPLEDVVGFIENRGWNYTYCGCWKCYGDPEPAKRCSAWYRACTAMYQQLYQGGTPALRLVRAG